MHSKTSVEFLSPAYLCRKDKTHERRSHAQIRDTVSWRATLHRSLISQRGIIGKCQLKSKSAESENLGKEKFHALAKIQVTSVSYGSQRSWSRHTTPPHGVDSLFLSSASNAGSASHSCRAKTSEELSDDDQLQSQGESQRQNRASNLTPAARLRELFAQTRCHLAPCCYDALSARLVEQAGFDIAVMSGFSVSAARLGLPDMGFLSYGEAVDQVGLMTSALTIPLIADADTGYGGALNIKRTVGGYRRAGAAALIIEDQVWPKACGHTEGRRVVPREEAVGRIRAAVDARDEGPGDILIIARSDARQAESLNEAMWRIQAFRDAGADAVFVDALESYDEMRQLCAAAHNVPRLANMLEGGGKTPILSPRELEDLGFQAAFYPLSLLGVSIKAMQDALLALKGGRLPSPAVMPSFQELRGTLAFESYYEDERRYVAGRQSGGGTASSSGAEVTASDAGQDATSDSLGQAASGADTTLISPEGEDFTRAIDILEEPETADFVIGEKGEDLTTPREPLRPEVEDAILAGSLMATSNRPGLVQTGFADTRRGSQETGGTMWGRTLHVRITGLDGRSKLDVRAPAGFMDGLAAVLPAIGGLNIAQMVQGALTGAPGSMSSDGQQVLVDFRDSRTNDRIEVILE